MAFEESSRLLGLNPSESVRSITAMRNDPQQKRKKKKRDQENMQSKDILELSCVTLEKSDPQDIAHGQLHYSNKQEDEHHDRIDLIA